MKPNIRKTMLFSALAAVSAAAWATNEPTAPLRVAEAVGQPSVTVESPRLQLDQRIQADVMEAVAAVPGIGGKIGVESNDAVVTLTGHTTTNGMAMRAARAAGTVKGVRYVQNEIRPLLGPTTL